MRGTAIAPSFLESPEPPARSESIDLQGYDHLLIGFSGGKDSLACLLHLLDCGADGLRIELHHHEVDGKGSRVFDWPVTGAYCQAIADTFRIPLYRSWREGGLLREMLRDGTPTAPVVFEDPYSGVVAVNGHGPAGTRLRFPQVTSDLRLRWCSAVAKIDVMRALICNSPRFLGKRVLVVTGERAEESGARAGYRRFEPHKTDTRFGTRRRRHVDHWRPVHGWTEREIWQTIQRHGVVPHVAYRLGFGRVSCLNCIFASANQLATVRWMAPHLFSPIAAYERQFGCTIKRTIDVTALADRGRPYEAALGRPDLVRLALSETWPGAVRCDPAAWELPPGAYGEKAGPS
jgi:3'-phosphoadenosine 5'-phosphosulfate sulfotransferase (PAPS reductase)/FAD synthetase